MEKNFKVGDIVIGTRDNMNVAATEGVKCKVTNIYNKGHFPFDMKVKVIEKESQYFGFQFLVYSKYFEKVNVAQPFTAMVNGVYCKCTPIEDKEELTRLWVNKISESLTRYKFEMVIKRKYTIVILSDDNWDTVKIGVARCADTDKCDYSIGKAVAAAKAMGEKIPDFLYE